MLGEKSKSASSPVRWPAQMETLVAQRRYLEYIEILLPARLLRIALSGQDNRLFLFP
jgi:hypothetical protein